ncbi:MAG: tRNA (adenosine(37)-N6)-threonylcarbamoyltransferase complex ATPase subunit type 1 TsaE [Bacteroidota bacterium]|jgi:tRNA threonylcarbamoyladenosine biosynthesis protein TsaE|nr:tRNA (adenosine(37)-N6)-threonylcarbamoyltransferase complex ATPase subunit type 1 TsaE [Algoriphagus sp.]
MASTVSYSLASIAQLAQRLVDEAGNEKIWVFRGPLGAGKTTLIKALAKVLHVTDPVSSPSFGIVHPYSTATKEEIFHFDFYRLESPEEALDIGIEEYFYSGNYCWIEWPEKIAPFLPEKFFMIEISTLSNLDRKVTFYHYQSGN